MESDQFFFYREHDNEREVVERSTQSCCIGSTRKMISTFMGGKSIFQSLSMPISVNGKHTDSFSNVQTREKVRKHFAGNGFFPKNAS